jgi:hypothetical protein
MKPVTALVSCLLSATVANASPVWSPQIRNIPLRYQSSGLNKRDIHSQPLYHEQPLAYLIDVGFGTPPQYFTLTIDTGSSDMWVPSTACSTLSGCLGPKFDATKSSTFVNSSIPFNIVYAVGAEKGTYGFDTIQIGGYNVTKQSFATVDMARNNTEQPKPTPYIVQDLLFIRYIKMDTYPIPALGCIWAAYMIRTTRDSLPLEELIIHCFMGKWISSKCRRTKA